MNRNEGEWIMERKFLSVLLVIGILLSLAAPVFGASSSGQTDFTRDKLRSLIVNQTTNITGLITNLVSADEIKDLAKSSIASMIKVSDIQSQTGSAIAAILEEGIQGSLGMALPASIRLSDLITDALGSDMINTIINSGFVGQVMDKTLSALIDRLVVPDVVNALADSVIDKVTEEIWNKGKPGSISVPFIGTRAYWNSASDSWDSTAISAKLLTVTGTIPSYLDKSDIDFVRIFGLDTIVSVHTKAIKEVATEYVETYRAVLISRLRERLNQIKDDGLPLFIQELNQLFGTKLSLFEHLDRLEPLMVKHIRDAKTYLSGDRDRLIRELKKLKSTVNNTNTTYPNLDVKRVTALLDSLIRCLEETRDKEPIIDPGLPTIIPSASVEKLSGNKNNLTITLTEQFADGSSKVLAKRIFSIDNNAADSYGVGGYQVYVDTKGNTQIRECRILD